MADESGQFSAIITRLKQASEAKLDTFYGQLIAQPKTTLILMVLMSAWFANIGMDFKDQIVDDLEIFLPEDAESTDLLMEVRTEWSTDFGIIYIQT